MRIHYIYNIQILALLAAFTACSSEESVDAPDSSKQSIALSVDVDSPASRAVISDGTGKTLSAFENATDIWMVMQSDYKALSGDNAAPGANDFQGSTTTTNCVTMGTTGDKTGTELKENEVNFTTDNTRYWDDAHGRSSALSVWAIAIPDVTGDASKWTGKSAKSWTTTLESKTIDWSVPAAQSAETVKNKDLCFSNNKVDYSSASGTDNRIKYSMSKFEVGTLIFYHALTKITIHMKEGDGFNKTVDTDFNLNSISLNGFNTAGKFDVAQGEFTSTSSKASITSMSQNKTVNDMTLEALVMPGRTLSASSDVMLEFSVDNNRFSVSEATILDQIQKGAGGSSWNTFEAGKNYVLEFTVSKTGIKLTATIAPWDNVIADNYAPKINITDSFGETGTDFGKGFSFLRSLNIASGYTVDADVAYAGTKYTMSPQLYWPNHDTHFFFRGVWPMIGSATDGTATPEGEVSDKAITVGNVPYAADKFPSDLMLGYPRTTNDVCTVHNKTVASEGICATEGVIRMNFRYVMSQVEVKLETTADGSPNKVIFDDKTSVQILGGYTDGKIMLGDGSVSYTGAPAPYTMNRAGSDILYRDAIIPQSLNDLKFKIVVRSNPDDDFLDSYETVLGIKDIMVEESGTKKKISAWEPGKHYVYTLTITKTGIKVTATIKDWITASGSTDIWM